MKTRLSILHINPHEKITDANYLKINPVADKLVSFDPGVMVGVEFIDFPISFDRGIGTELELLHSLASTPARYIESAVARGIELGLEGNFLVLNPAVYLDSDLYNLMVDSSVEMENADIGIMADIHDKPLGYFIGSDLLKKMSSEKLFRLRFLSAISAAVDASYLETAFGSKPRLLVSSVKAKIDKYSGFLINGQEGIYTFSTLSAGSAFGLSGDQLPKKRIAVMPYHAGDILFFIKAVESVQHYFNILLVHEEFVPIVKRMGTQMEVLAINESSIRRGANADSSLTTHENREDLFFYHVLYPHIPQDALFYWFRPSRDYNLAKSHMIDQWKSALTNDSFSLVADEKRSFASKTEARQKSVLLHFDGGWHLKVYPFAAQVKLIELLKMRGYKVSVLTDKPLGYSCDVFPFQNLAKLEENILGHSIFIGMDSFPAHYATHVFKHPTLCLYSSTREENSNAAVFEGYRSMQSNLACSPCYAADRCPLFSVDFCQNFSSPGSVADAADEMFQRCYGRDAQ